MATEYFTKADGSSAGLNLDEIIRDCLACGVIVLDARQRISACSEAIERWLAMRKKPKARLQPVTSLPAPLAEMLIRAFAKGERLRDRRLVLPGKDGQELTLCVHTTPVQNTRGRTTGLVAVVNKLRLPANLNENLRQLEQTASVGTMSASMAHEIKNALVAVKTFFEVMLKKSAALELAGIAGKEIRRIDALVSQMLRVSGPAQPAFTRLQAQGVLEHSLRVIQYQLEAKSISLQRSFTTEPTWVRGDAYQLEQAFLNLLLNALDAMSTGGELTVTTETRAPSPGAEPGSAAAGPHLCVSIQDNGIGIAPENLGRLFEPFFTTKGQGTGLGLAITRRIIEAHTGSIAVQSEPRHGTTFTIVLPLTAQG